MRKALATLLLSILCVAMPKGAPSGALPAIVRLWDATRPICTTFAIGPHSFMTAAHCVLEYDEEAPDDTPGVPGFRTLHTPTGEAMKADIIKWDERLDLAVLQVVAAEVEAPLHFSSDSPSVGDAVQLVGFPRMWVRPGGLPITFTDRVAALHVQTDCYGPISSSTPYQTLLQGSGAPGNSGSPVLEGGRVVGLLQCGFPQAIEAAAPWDVLLRWLNSQRIPLRF